MSSHFMPSPRSPMILVSSSCDHLDCFLAGDSAGCVTLADCRFVGTVPVELVSVGSATAFDATVTGTDAERAAGCAMGSEGDTSSSFGSTRREISTLPDCARLYTGSGWGCCCMQIMCALENDQDDNNKTPAAVFLTTVYFDTGYFGSPGFTATSSSCDHDPGRALLLHR